MRFSLRLVSLAAALAVTSGTQAQDSPAKTGDPAASKPSRRGTEKDPDQIGNRNVDKGVNFYSIEKEMALGRALAQQVEKMSVVIDDPEIAEYVNRVGQNLARNSDAKIPLTVKVIRDEQVNAMSLPGGYLFVNTGLLLTADSESELAGAMAHEVAHVAARHATRQATRGQIGSMASIPLILMGGWGGVGARAGAGAAGAMVGPALSREFEAEADLLGLEYMYKAGYDPNGFVNIFEKILSLDRRRPGVVSKLFLSHPPTGNRIEAVQKNIQNLLKAQPQYVVNTSEFDTMKARLQALEDRRKASPPSPDRPTLRTRPNERLG